MAPAPKPQITIDAKTAVLVVLGLLGAGGGTGYFTKPSAEDLAGVESEVEVKLAQKYKNKEMLDSIGRVAASVCALRSQVTDVQTDVRSLIDTMNSMNKRTGQTPIRARSVTYSMKIP